MSCVDDISTITIQDARRTVALQVGGANAQRAVQSAPTPQGVRNGLKIVPQIRGMIFIEPVL